MTPLSVLNDGVRRRETRNIRCREPERSLQLPPPGQPAASAAWPVQIGKRGLPLGDPRSLRVTARRQRLTATQAPGLTTFFVYRGAPSRPPLARCPYLRLGRRPAARAAALVGPPSARDALRTAPRGTRRLKAYGRNGQSSDVAAAPATKTAGDLPSVRAAPRPLFIPPITLSRSCLSFSLSPDPPSSTPPPPFLARLAGRDGACPKQAGRRHTHANTMRDGACPK